MITTPAHLTRLATALLLLLLTRACPAVAAPASPLNVDILYLHQAVERPPLLSNLQPPVIDEGQRGAEVGIDDSNTTGRFLGHRYHLQVQAVDSAEQALAAAAKWIAAGHTLILSHLPAASLKPMLASADVAGKALVFNVSARDNSLRSSSCRTGLLHTLPSRAMLADALVQFLIARKWKRWLLVSGERAGDRAYANALKRAAKRFGGKIVAEKTWRFDTDLRRTAQQEMPLFTQAGDYDVVLVADELGDVGEFVPFNTWLPRPVAGTQGLSATAWHSAVEQWGAIQLQNRFQAHAQRPMNDIDYAGWAAVRAIAEAVTRTGSNEAAVLYEYLNDPRFELAGFKGRKMSFRTWNGQLRQPIPLVQPRALVSQSPQAGFLHPQTELDTLGLDQREVSCPYESTL